jgi:hypothetical protein
MICKGRKYEFVLSAMEIHHLLIPHPSSLTRCFHEDGVHWLVEHLLPKSMLFQVEYAIEAIKLGSTTVRLKTKDGVVLAGEERVTSSLLLQTFLTERGLD